MLVTGGTRGIGLAIAESFIRAGYPTAVTSKSSNTAPPGSLHIKADVTSTADIDTAFSAIENELGSVGILVANAGIVQDNLLMRMSEEEFFDVINTNLFGVFRCVKRGIKNMVKQRFGRIILISSVVGMYGSPGQVNYASSKSALVGFARSLTRELAARGINTNVISPGFIQTDMTSSLEAVKDSYIKAIPAGRIGQPQDVANAALWLASPDSSYISGAIIPVDGGLGMGH